MSRQTILRLGSKTNRKFIDKRMFDLAHNFSVLPPAEVKRSTNLIRYEVPHASISGFVETNKTHLIETDSLSTSMRTVAIEQVNRPTEWMQENPRLPRSFDRITIYRQLVFNNTFLLKKDAKFSYVVFIKERTDSTVFFEDNKWTIVSQISYICPFENVSNPDRIIFKCDPQYSVELHTDGFPDMIKIERVCKLCLPGVFQMT